jgi:hypothetical protein
MHYLIFVLAEGETAQEASEAAFSVLDQYSDQVFDYRGDDAGGWDEFPASASKDRERFDRQLERARGSRNAGIAMHLSSIARSLSAELPNARDIDAPHPPTLEQMQSLGSAAFGRLHKQLFDGARRGPFEGLTGYSLKRLAQLAMGDFVLDGHFLDATDRFGEPGVIPASAEIDEAVAAGAPLWIIPVDVHN